MTAATDFAYVQARLHARHGGRLDAPAWRRLETAGSLLQLLQAARNTALRPWVLPLTRDSAVHALEHWPRGHFRDYVHEVSGWQPLPWRGAVAWSARLPDLAALQHLLAGEVPWPWMHDDPGLAGFLDDDPGLRREAMAAGDCAPMVAAWDAGRPLVDGWLEHWRGLWPPASRRHRRALEALAALLRGHLAAVAVAADAAATAARDRWLEARLEAMFRRHTQQPVAVYVHLALVALDVRRLRGALVRQRLFGDAAAPAVQEVA